MSETFIDVISETNILKYGGNVYEDTHTFVY